jgi:hypothetical protein
VIDVQKQANPEVKKIYGKYCVGENMQNQSNHILYTRKCKLDRQFGRYVEVSKCKVYCFYFIQEI